MPHSFVNPYSGTEEETCSVSFAAQQQLGAHHPTSPQTEAQFNLSRLLGEWGVISAKYKKGQLFNGLKVMTFKKPSNGLRGYLYIKDGQLWRRVYYSGKVSDKQTNFATGEALIRDGSYVVSLPTTLAAEKEAAKKGSEPELPKVKVSKLPQFQTLKSAGVAEEGSEFLLHGATSKDMSLLGVHVKVVGQPTYGKNPSAVKLVEVSTGKQVGQQVSSSAKWWINPLSAEKDASVKNPIAAPVPVSSVNAGSTSVGSMSDEDVAAMFVKVKDDLAREQGLNIKGSNPDLDRVVYAKIGQATGYTTEEVKGKIDAYRASGKKLSALKKKVMASAKAKEGKAAETKATPAAPLTAGKRTSKPAQDPQPNDVPTVATPRLADSVKAEVKTAVAKQPQKGYTDEDVAAAYIIAKDQVVANSGGKWTLYSKNSEMDQAIADIVRDKTGLNPYQQRSAIAGYLASGKKLSALKKQLARQGAFTPKADTGKTSAPTSEGKKLEDAIRRAIADEGADASETTKLLGSKMTFTDSTGVSAAPRSVYLHDSGGDMGRAVSANFTITSSDSERRGSAERIFYVQDGELRVRHEYLRLPSSFRGAGFSARWNEHNESLYREMGIKQIFLTANIDVGGYAWAKQGYEFLDDEQASLLASKLEKVLDTIPATIQAEARELISRARGNGKRPLPLEFAMLGWSKGETMWPGKEFMLKQEWKGVKTL